MRVILLALASFGLAAAASAESRLLPFPVHVDSLKNGLKIVVVPMPSPGLVTLYSIVRTGSRDEVEPGKSGFAHFFEHMMFQGTQKFPRDAYQAAVSRTGAQSNAFTSDDLTAFYFTVAKPDLEKVLEIESDRFRNLDYGVMAFQTEAGAVYGEYRKSQGNPFFRLHEKTQELAFKVHPYGHTTLGYEADIQKMPDGYEFSRAFFRRFYRPENVTLLLVGDVLPAEVRPLAEKYYAGWMPGYRPTDVRPEPPQTAERFAEISYPGRTLPLLSLAYKCDRFDPANRDYVAAAVIEDLAFGPTSDLYKRLVLREQKVDGLEASAPMNRDPALFQIIARIVKESDLPTVQKAIENALDDLKTKPIDPAKLADVKRRAKYAFLMELDSPDKVAKVLARIIAVSDDIASIERYYAELDKIEPADVAHAAKKYFDPAKRTRVILKGAK